LVADRGSMTDHEELVSTASVNHYSIKAPPFYRKSPEIWFRQLESQFHLAKITNPVTKYHHVMASLPEEVARDFFGVENENYDDLKSAILQNLKANKHELIEDALATLELGNKRPSQLVSEIKRKFREIDVAVDDSIVKSRLLSALPCNLRSALVGHDNVSLDQYAKIADSMVSVVGISTPFVSINAASASTNEKQRRTRIPLNEIKYPVIPFHKDQRQKICNAHIFYGNQARTCRYWCKWPGNQVKKIDNRQETPKQSRASSPSNS